MKIEVCGSGCSKCAELEKRAKDAVARTGIDGKTVASGKIPSVEEIASLLRR